VGALVLWLVPTVDRSEPGVFWPDLPPERLAVIAGVCWFGLGVALRALGLVAHFALFHVLLWLDTRVGVDHGGLTFADWMRELHARERLAGLEARRRRGRPIIDLRQKRAGRRASLAGQPVTANPFPSDSPAGVAWARGYQEWAMLALEVREHWRPAAWDETHPDP
jgi:hypothetical protein